LFVAVPGPVGEGADSHELSEQQHFFVEKDPESLASALLMPAAIFAETFNAKRCELEAAGAPALNVLRKTLKHATEVFQVSPKNATVRALKLRLLTREEAIANIRDAIQGYLHSLEKHNEPIPNPVAEEIVDVPV
jgi:hypothetical protein